MSYAVAFVIVVFVVVVVVVVVAVVVVVVDALLGGASISLSALFYTTMSFFNQLCIR